MYRAFALVIWCLAWSCGAEAQDPFHRRYSVADGLPSNTVYRAVHDRQGFMWFATDAGVARFDGIEFRVFSTRDGLGDNEIITLYEDSKGRIWFLGLNGSLSFWHEGLMHNGSTDPELARYRGRSGWHTVAEDGHGRMWFGGIYGERLCLDLEGGTDTLYASAMGRSSLWSDEQGRIWVEGGTATGAVHVAECWARLEASVMPSESTVEGVNDPGQLPILLLGDSIVEIHNGSTRLVVRGLRLDPGVPYRTCWRDRTGHIWMYRKDLGVDLLKVADGKSMGITHLFANMTVKTVYQDRVGNHWVCTGGDGVRFIRAGALEHTRIHRAFPERKGMFQCMHAQDGQVWIGSDRAGAFQYDGTGLRSLGSLDAYQFKGRVLRIHGRDGSGPWLGCDFGLLKYDARTRRFLPVPCDALLGRRISRRQTPAKSVYVEPSGKVWTGAHGLDVLYTPGGPYVRAQFERKAFSADRITCITQDASGVLWFDADNAVISLKDTVRTMHPLRTDHALSRITDLQCVRGDTLVIATSSDGLLLWSQGRPIRSLGTEDGLASLSVHRVRVYGDTLLAATTAGVSALVLKAGSVVDSWSWGTWEGLPSADVRDALFYRGRLLSITAEGLCESDVRPQRGDPAVPRLHLAHVLVNGVAADAAGPVRLRSGMDRISIAVHAVAFSGPEAVEYVYRLNRTGDWASCVQGQVSLERVGPDDQRVEVRARYPAGAWSEPLGLDLTVIPPWWATPIARWGAFFAGVSLLLFVVNGVFRRRYKRQLEAVRAQAALDAERRRIAADVHDDLGADLSRLLMHARHGEAADGSASRKRVSEGLAGVIDKIDEIIWALDPRRDTLRSTVDFVEQYARDLAETNGLRFRTAVDIGEHDVHVPAEQRRELMLIAREALRNVIEHARAGELRVEWSRQGGSLTLMIADDGTGMAASFPPGRHGLENMEQRAQRIGGRLTIASAPGKGTRVVVEVPVDENHPIG